MPAEDEAESTTKATVSEGEIEIRDKENQKQDIAGLNRDTQNALNKLGEIFDKDDIEEKQEFIGLAQEIGHNMIGDLTGKISDEQKAMLNAFLEGLISQWANGDFLSGASGAAVTEAAQEALNNIEDPAVRQIAVGLLSAAITKAAGGNASAAASAGISTEKYNHIPHEDQQYLLRDIEKYEQGKITKEEFLEKMLYYYALDQYYYENLYPDNISDNLTLGDNIWLISDLSKTSLMEVFKNNNIDTSNGFAKAFQDYLLLNGINIENYTSEFNKFKQEIVDERGEISVNTSDLLDQYKPGFNKNDTTERDTISDGSNLPKFDGDFVISGVPDDVNNYILYADNNSQIILNYLQHNEPSINIATDVDSSSDKYAGINLSEVGSVLHGEVKINNLYSNEDRNFATVDIIKGSANMNIAFDENGLYLGAELYAAGLETTTGTKFTLGDFVFEINGHLYTAGLGAGGKLTFNPASSKVASLKLFVVKWIGAGIDVNINKNE